MHSECLSSTHYSFIDPKRLNWPCWLTYRGSDVNKDLRLKARDLDPKAEDLGPKAKDLSAKDSRCQSQISHLSFTSFLMFMFCEYFYVCVLISV